MGRYTNLYFVTFLQCYVGMLALAESAWVIISVLVADKLCLCAVLNKRPQNTKRSERNSSR